MANDFYGTEGIHIIADFYGIDNTSYLKDTAWGERLCEGAIKESKATLLEMHSKGFSPHGYTVVAILSESSMDMHSYPEHGHLSVSFHTCGEKADPLLGIKFLHDKLKPKKDNTIIINRGKISQLTTKELEL